jgi:hypothetical protein
VTGWYVLAAVAAFAAATAAGAASAPWWLVWALIILGCLFVWIALVLFAVTPTGP